MTGTDTEVMIREVEQVREFGRFYTRYLGALNEHLLQSPFALTEARILYELAHRRVTDSVTLSAELGLDSGYLSRVVGRLVEKGVISRESSPEDGRVRLLALTVEGDNAFAQLNAASTESVKRALAQLSAEGREHLVRSMQRIQSLLGARGNDLTPYILRSQHPGDLGWVVQRHGAIYSREYHWDIRFEGLVAEIVGAFARDFDPTCERCWIAEKDDQNVGSVFLVKKSTTVAQLRLLLVEQSARGLGIGGRLVQECSRFARQVGYTSITLWTNSVLSSARRIYEAEGYRLVAEEPHESFGHQLMGQNWELDL